MKSIKLRVLVIFVLIVLGVVPTMASNLTYLNNSGYSGVFEGGPRPHNAVGGGGYSEDESSRNLASGVNSEISAIGETPGLVYYTAVVYPEYLGTVYRSSHNESFTAINTGDGSAIEPSYDAITWLIGDSQTDRFKEEYKGVYSFNFSNAAIPTNAVFTSATMRTLAYIKHPNTLGNTRYTITQLNPPDQISLNKTAYPYRYYNNTVLSDWIAQPVGNVNVDLNYTFNSIGLAYLQDTASKSKPANLSVRSSWDISNNFNGTWGNASETGIDTYGMSGVSATHPYIALNYYVSVPAASFTVNTTSGTAPLTVTFTDTSTGTGITTWNWSFGDGTWESTNSNTHQVHIYTAGTWYPRLTVTTASGSNTSLITPARTLTVTPAPLPASTKIGVYKDGKWYLDTNGDGIFNAGDSAYSFGSPGWPSVVGDWNGNGKTGIGVSRDGMWYLDYNGNGAFDTGDKVYAFGLPTWSSVVGDWNGLGKTEIGVYKDGSWYLDYNGNGAFDTGDKAYAFGATGWPSVAGDWNPSIPGTKIGVYKDGMWYLDYNGNGVFDTNDKAYAFGATGWSSVVGDWNPSIPGTKIGVYKDGMWYLDYNGNGAFDTGDKVYAFGLPTWSSVVGDWNGDGKTEIGVYKDGTWYLDTNGDGVFNTGDSVYSFGLTGWSSVIGKWS
jgi:PKD repeat protein